MAMIHAPKQQLDFLTSGSSFVTFTQVLLYIQTILCTLEAVAVDKYTKESKSMIASTQTKNKLEKTNTLHKRPKMISKYERSVTIYYASTQLSLCTIES